MLMSIKESHRPEPSRFNSQEHGGIEMAESPSLRSPEVVAGPSPTWEQCLLLNETKTAYTGGVDSKMREHDPDSIHGSVVATDYPSSLPPSDLNNAEKDGLGESQRYASRPKRFFGLGKTRFIIIIGLILLVVVGAVLGGVLGTLLTREHQSYVASSF